MIHHNQIQELLEELTTEARIAAFVAAFEATSLPRPRWTHGAHLTVAFWTLEHRPFAAALAHLRDRIRAYNGATGTANTDSSGYHETLTVHFLLAVAGERARCSGLAPVQALEALLRSPLADPDWPLQAYSPERLTSPEARHRWVEPDRGPQVLWAEGVRPRPRSTNYPPPFAALMAGRERQVLGDPFGLSRFGVNRTRIEPGGRTALRHAHQLQDEFVYVLEGHPTLVTNAGERQLAPGMAVGFAAGDGNAHHLINRTGLDVVLLEIGDRTPNDQATYPDDDLRAEQVEGSWRFSRRDGSPW
jgi:uncharacterized cupin superfamily protein